MQNNYNKAISKISEYGVYLLVIFFLFLGESGVLGQSDSTIRITIYPSGSRKVTSSKEKYDDNKYKAAHPNLAFGTKVVIFRPDNGKSVTVEINDRCKANMVITGIAGKALDLQGNQVVNASIYLKSATISSPNKPEEETQTRKSFLMRKVNIKTKAYGIKVAQSNDYEEIKTYIQFMQNMGYTNLLCHCYNEDNQDAMCFRLLVGPFSEKKEAIKTYNELINKKMAAKIIDLNKLK